ncbi:sigma 54-interacting transcriptional regulator [Neobacillus sp. PS2-9]|uniref:sigma-54 interaction domain-containing protein n=1 Tax=Neobacillus sp. PS2-9 TaxID=3070676 RepID=UPI0027DF7E4D|nr:sigma 54-interacting transcriptional regulator [Neobacillus sp. PS2-9]WML59332.1 sigma 54-interacting transcriptional regulator [Neobacillus sp. PS2-9]
MLERGPSALTWKFMTRIFQHFEEGVIIIDPEGVVLIFNTSARKILKTTQAVNTIKDLPREIQNMWENRYQRFTNLQAPEMGVEIIPGFGDGMALIMRNPKQAESLEQAAYRDEAQVLIDLSIDDIIIADRQGKILKVNDKCEQIYNCSKEQLIGRNVRDLEQEGVFFPSAIALAIDKKENISILQETVNKKRLLVQANILWEKNAEIYRVICTSKDISTIEPRFLLPTLHSQNDFIDILRQENFVIKSGRMKEFFRFASKVAKSDSTILLLGESGNGKSELARLIHKMSKRQHQPFVSINCAAVPETLMESEMFGYEDGAFTGTKRQGKKGLFELANGGTIFLDEVAELPLSMQAKFLHVLQNKSFYRVGGSEVIHVNVRVLAATNQNLEELVENGKFRKDLYYRLHVIPLAIPPLRERPEDIIPLLLTSLEKIIARDGIEKQFSTEVMSLLSRYQWPGNVRELENTVEWLCVASDGETIEVDALPPKFKESLLGIHGEVPIIINKVIPLKEAIDLVEKELIKKARTMVSSTYKIADLLKINQSTVVRKLNKMDIM